MAHAHATNRMAACFGMRNGGLGFIVGLSDNGWMDRFKCHWLGETSPVCPSRWDPLGQLYGLPLEFTMDRMNECPSLLQAKKWWRVGTHVPDEWSTCESKARANGKRNAPWLVHENGNEGINACLLCGICRGNAIAKWYNLQDVG